MERRKGVSAVLVLAVLLLAVFLVGYFLRRQRRSISDEAPPVDGIQEAGSRTLADAPPQRQLVPRTAAGPIAHPPTRRKTQSMLATDREILAYDIRRDAEYTRQRLELHAREPDSPTGPAVRAAAEYFCQWCDTASDELTTDPELSVEQVRQEWRRQAVASDVRFKPHGDLALLIAVGSAPTTCMITAIALAAGSIQAWIIALATGLIAVVAFNYRYWTPSRLAVGPDAQHSTMAAATPREILNNVRPPRRRYQPRLVDPKQAK